MKDKRGRIVYINGVIIKITSLRGTIRQLTDYTGHSMKDNAYLPGVRLTGNKPP